MSLAAPEIELARALSGCPRFIAVARRWLVSPAEVR